MSKEKKSADDEFNAQLKALDSQMQAIARILKTPWTSESVKCTWRVIEGENARGLYRVEMLEKAPITEEDRVLELQRAETANAQPVDGAVPSSHEEVTEAAEIGSFVNQRNSGRRKRKAAPVSGQATEAEEGNTGGEQPEPDTDAASAIVDEMQEEERPRTDPLAGELEAAGNGKRRRKRAVN